MGTFSHEEIDVESIEDLTLTVAKLNSNPYMQFSVFQDLIDSLIYTGRHFSSDEFEHLNDIKFHFTSSSEDIVEPLPTLFNKIVKSLLLTSTRLTQTTVERAYCSSLEQDYDYYQMVIDYYDSEPCKIYEFKPKAKV